MQIASIGNNLHEMSDSVFWKIKKSIISLSSAKLAKKLVKIKTAMSMMMKSQAAFILKTNKQKKNNKKQKNNNE